MLFLGVAVVTAATLFILKRRRGAVTPDYDIRGQAGSGAFDMLEPQPTTCRGGPFDRLRTSRTRR